MSNMSNMSSASFKQFGPQTGAEGAEYLELVKNIDALNVGVESLQTKTKEYLQPNPTARANDPTIYSQKENNLADVFTKLGSCLQGKWSKESPYASSIQELGESFQHLSDAKDTMGNVVANIFLWPLSEMQQKDLKEIAHYRKEYEERQLDYINSNGAMELQAAADKSRNLSRTSMKNFLEREVEHITPFYKFAEALLIYHKNCSSVMELVVDNLYESLKEAASKPQPERRSPCCRALYDFKAENKGELAFNDGDMIELTSRTDENWLMGKCNGKEGIFPENFVEIIVPMNNN